MNDDGWKMYSYADLLKEEQRMRTPEEHNEQCELEYRRGYCDGWIQAINTMYDLLKARDGRNAAYESCYQHWDRPLLTWKRDFRNGRMDFPPRLTLAEPYEQRRLNQQLHRARKHGLPATLTLKEWITTIKYYDAKCAYCGKSFDVLEHFVPVSDGGGTTSYNCVPACKQCNTTKGTQNPLKTKVYGIPSEQIASVYKYLSAQFKG